jgi:hypothetical protein
MGIPALNPGGNRAKPPAPAPQNVKPNISFEEHPSRAFRGLMFVIIFDVLLCAIGAAVWLLWHFARS